MKIPPLSLSPPSHFVSLKKKAKKGKKEGKIIPQPHNILLNPPETLRQKNKKNTKN
jgi:hypothetical protein